MSSLPLWFQCNEPQRADQHSLCSVGKWLRIKPACELSDYSDHQLIGPSECLCHYLNVRVGLSRALWRGSRDWGQVGRSRAGHVWRQFRNIKLFFLLGKTSRTWKNLYWANSSGVKSSTFNDFILTGSNKSAFIHGATDPYPIPQEIRQHW